MSPLPLDVKRRGSSLLGLEESIIRQTREILSQAWRPNANNDFLVIRLGVLCKVLEDAGYNTEPIRRQWKNAFEVYNLDGGRARFREIENL